MTFEEAVAWMKRGERIKRAHWRSAYLFLENDKVKMSMGFRRPWHYNFKNHDITATDWLIHADKSFDDDDEKYSEPKPLTGKLKYDTTY